MDLLQMKDWKHADLFQQVADEEFDEATFISNALTASPFRHLEKLAAAVKEIDDEIRSQVNARQSEFLSQAGYVEELEVKYQSVQNRVRNLKRSVARLKSDLLVPFETLQTSSLKLANIQSVNEVLWHCHTVMKLVRKLRVQTRTCAAYADSSSSAKSTQLIRELAKAAQTLSDINAVMNDSTVNVEGVDVLEQQVPFIETSSDLVRKESRRALDRAVDTMNRNDIGGALQVFYNLHELGSAVDQSLKRSLSNFKQSATRLLDVGTVSEQGLISRAIQPADRHNAGTRAALWKRVDEFVESIQAHVQQVWNLQLVLIQKVDPVSHTCFFDVWKDHRRGEEGQDVSIMLKFWGSICDLLNVQFQSKAPGSKFVTSVFTNEFPRLHQVFDDLFQRLQRSIQVPTDGVRASGLSSKNARDDLMHTLLPYQYGFLGNGLSQLNTAIDSMFAKSSSLPTVAGVSNFVSVMHKSLEQVASSTSQLQTEVAKSISKAVVMFVSKCESLLESKVEPVCHYTAAEAPSSHLRRNAELFGALCQVDKALSLSQLRRTVPQLATPAETVLRKAWTSLRDVCNECLRHLVSCVALDLDGALRHIHDEDFGKNSPQFVNDKRSKYMQNLQLLVDYFLRNILCLYQTQRTSLERRQQLAKHLLWLAEHVVEEFVMHVSLIHPLSESGMLELTADIAHLEGLLHSLIPDKSNDVALYEKLRSLKDVLFMDTLQIADANDFGVIPLLQHLMSRHITPDGSSPMPAESLGWTLDKYLTWVKAHDQNECVKLIEMAFHQHLERLSLSVESVTSRAEYVKSRYPALYTIHQVLHPS